MNFTPITFLSFCPKRDEGRAVVPGWMACPAWNRSCGDLGPTSARQRHVARFLTVDLLKPRLNRGIVVAILFIYFFDSVHHLFEITLFC